jgi:hypothetical protein
MTAFEAGIASSAVKRVVRHDDIVASSRNAAHCSVPVRSLVASSIAMTLPGIGTAAVLRNPQLAGG